MSEYNESNRIDRKYIFFFKPNKQNPKTEIWQIYTQKNNYWLGTITYSGRWRQYIYQIDCLLMKDKLDFSAGCLTDIINFIKELNQKQRDKQKINKINFPAKFPVINNSLPGSL